MSYRIKEKPKHKPNRTFTDITTVSSTFVQNGVTAYIAIPCWYVEIKPPVYAHHHDREHHDHVGWPSPNHPDHICQAWDFAHSCCSFDKHKHKCDRCSRYLDMERVHPIHLAKEGYSEIKVALLDPPEGLTASGNIDKKEDWVVRVLFSAQCPSAVKEEKKVEYSVFAIGNVPGRGRVSDIIARGKLVILPGPIGA